MIFEYYDYDNKIPMDKIDEMLKIIIKFYNKFNKRNNSTEEVYSPWINIVRNTKDYHVLLCYLDKELVGFINYMYQENGLMLSEIQIKDQFQGKNDILRKMIGEVLNISDKNKYSEILCTINPKNEKSKLIFTHIGFKNIEGILYKIDYNNLLNWVNKNVKS